MAQRDLKFVLHGQDKSASRTLDKVSGKAGGVSSSFAKLGKAAVAGFAVAGAAAAAFAVKGIQDAAALDTKLREVNTLFGLTGKAGADNFKDLQGLVKGLSKEVGIAQVTLTEGLYNAISAGVPKDNAFEFMKVASQAAVAGVTDVNTAVDGMTSIINAFSLSAADAGKVADSMFTAVKGGKTTFKEISDAIFNVAPAAAAAGVAFEEVNAGIATLTAGGTPTSVAATQMRAALTGLARPSKDLNKIFRKFGFENAQAAVKSKGLTFALKAVKDASKGNNGELMKLLGSTEAVSAANVIAGTGMAKMTTEMEAQKSSAGATSTAFEEMNKSAGRTFERLKVAMQNLGIEVGNYLLPKILQLAEEFEKGEGTGGELKDVMVTVRDAMRDAWPEIKAVFSATKSVVDFVIANQGAFGPIITAVGTYAAVMKAAAVASAAMAVAGPGAAGGIAVTGAASAAWAGPIAAAAAALAGWVYWMRQASASESNTASIIAGTPTATIGSATPTRKNGVTQPVKVNTPGGVIDFGGKKIPTGRSGDENRRPRGNVMVGAGGPPIIINHKTVVDGKTVAESTNRYNDGRKARGGR